MPVLAKFNGIVIRMLFARLLAPHFYAICGDAEMVVSIRPVRVIQGDAPASAREQVLAWATQHQQELMAAWNRCQVHLAPVAIAPPKLA